MMRFKSRTIETDIKSVVLSKSACVQGELNPGFSLYAEAIPGSPKGHGNVAKDRDKCLASTENSPNPTKL